MGLILQEAKEFVNRGDLDVVEHDPPSHPDRGEKVRKFDLGQRVGVGAIEQHQIHVAVQPVPGHGLPGLPFDEGYLAGEEIAMRP